MSCSLLDFGEDQDDLVRGSGDDRLPWSPAATAVVTPSTPSFPINIFSKSSQHSFISAASSTETIDPSVFLKSTPLLSNNGSGLLVTVDVELEHQPETDVESVKLDDHDDLVDIDEDTDESTHSIQQPSTPASSNDDRDIAYTAPYEMKVELAQGEVSRHQEPDIATVSERVKRTRRGVKVSRDRTFSPSPPPKSERGSSPDLADGHSEDDVTDASSMVVKPAKKKSKRRPRVKAVHGTNRSEQNKRAQKKYRDKRKEIALLVSTSKWKDADAAKNHDTLIRLFGAVLNELPQMTKPAMLGRLRQHKKRWMEELKALDPVIAAAVREDL